MKEHRHKSHSPSPRILAQAVHRQMHGNDIPPPAQAGFSLVEVMLGIAVISVLGIGTFKIAQHLENKRSIRTEQDHVQEIANKVGAAYSSVGRYPINIEAAAISDRLVPATMMQGAAMRSAWGAAVHLETTTIDGRANAGMEIIYESVPISGCAPLAVAGGSGMFNVEINGNSVMDADGNVDPLQAASQCDSGPSEVVFTYYSGASGLALAPPPALCVSDPSNPLCAAPAPPTAVPPPLQRHPRHRLLRRQRLLCRRLHRRACQSRPQA